MRTRLFRNAIIFAACIFALSLLKESSFASAGQKSANKYGLAQKQIKHSIPVIAVSTAPIGSVFAMLVKDVALVEVIANGDDCPHHYHVKPSDLQKIREADLAVYISDEFDDFAGKLMAGNNKKLVKITDFSSLKWIKDDHGNVNWHFWLDLDNISNLLFEMKNIALELWPASKQIIERNMTDAQVKIKQLQKIKQETLNGNAKIILLSDSLEYFFSASKFISANSLRNKKAASDWPIVKLYDSGAKSLWHIQRLQNLVKILGSGYCALISQEQNADIYKNIDVRLVQIASENLGNDTENTTELSGLFYRKYLEMIYQLAGCYK